MTNSNYQDNINAVINEYFTTYSEYNEITINDYFTGLFYEIHTKEELEVANAAEQLVRDMVFNGGIK